VANVAIVNAAIGGAILVWTDTDRANPSVSRRNVFAVGHNLIAIHDMVDPWLPVVAPIFADPALAALPTVEALAPALAASLGTVAKVRSEPLGVIIAGFTASGAALGFGLRSETGFTPPNPIGEVVLGGLPSSVLDYVTTVLRPIPSTSVNVLDKLVLVGDIYGTAILARAGLPSDSDIARLERGVSLAWLAPGEVDQSRERNGKRLRALHLAMSRILSEQ
jgi:hypothetical protein